MKTKEETKQALRRARDEYESIGHYLSMVECAFGVDGLSELTDALTALLDQVPDDEAAERPDTQERIDEDARKAFDEYWGCREGVFPELGCAECPAKIDGKSPAKYYDTVGCGFAKTLDLLRRQRELDARRAER